MGRRRGALPGVCRLSPPPSPLRNISYSRGEFQRTGGIASAPADEGKPGLDEDAAREPAAPVISRRRLLTAGVLSGTAAALAACGSHVTIGTPFPTTTRLPSGGPIATLPGSPPASGSPAPSSSVLPPSLPPSLPPNRDTSMAAENAQHGDPRWDRGRADRGVRAYLGVASVGPGQPLALRAAGIGTVDVEWYRLGWYHGAGARLVSVDRGVRLGGQPRASLDPATGLIECRWAPVLSSTAPAGTKSGMLLAVLRTPAGQSVANVPVILRPDPTDPRRAPVLFISAASTWQAYNSWGGSDFYTDLVTSGTPRAVKVSFDRPYALDAGAAYLRRWELPFIRWLERNGRDVEYVADVDLERNPSLLDQRRLLVMAGHLEYWSRPMRERLEAAVAGGTNVAFLTANEVYWQTRLEDGPAGPGSRIVCYKSASADPITASRPSDATTRWRQPPVNDPEAPLVGEMYGSVVRTAADWVVAGRRHWLYEGTGLRDGDAITNLVGQEFDTLYPSFANPGTVVLARSPVDAEPMVTDVPGLAPGLPVHNSTIYTAASGATVFAAGTFQWSWALDAYGNRTYQGAQTPVDGRVGRMTRNLFDRLGDGPLGP